MTFEKLLGLIKQKGFRDTMKVLSQFKEFKIDKHTFYNELNKFSYYNSFFRVKDDLISTGLFTITQNNGSKIFQLTEKGINIYQRLDEINKLIEKKN